MVGKLLDSDVSSARSEPVRTCVGCRERATKSDLVRVVAVQDAATVVAAPDIHGSAAGRGAHLHPTTGCLEQAVQRRAFARALRVQGPVDVSSLRAYVQNRSDRQDAQAGPRASSPEPVTDRKRSTSS